MSHKKFVKTTFSYNEVLDDDSEGHYKIKVFHHPSHLFSDVHKEEYGWGFD
ncbi:20503_t:CDS:2 [Rhizophagus irregularis]|nr:20503_t:CDS:2 [Rhizophagus irregularis]